ncbi:zeta toxin family protein [Campylobacter sp. RM16188]|uniref:zeta toxin family protein n=1 Tax=Campylobacter sp. RM16188 TaxID=1705725 RepID=UPI001556D09D|nr:zeta toxin family protein [Campylobacter sp. RM16188]
MNELLEWIWHKTIDSNITTQLNPIGYVLGGQPGAGKSKLTEKIQDASSYNILVINADEFRKYHPHYHEFQIQNDKTSQDKTSNFIAEATEYMLKRAIKNRFNLVVEGTFRTATTPIKTLKLLKENNYQTSVNILLTSQELSWASCVERYEKAIKFKRHTPKAHHDLVISKIAQNIDEVLQSKLADKLEIFIRDFNGELIDLFSSKKDIYSQDLVNKILECTTQNELENIIKNKKMIHNILEIKENLQNTNENNTSCRPRFKP